MNQLNLRFSQKKYGDRDKKFIPTSPHYKNTRIDTRFNHCYHSTHWNDWLWFISNRLSQFLPSNNRRSFRSKLCGDEFFHLCLWHFSYLWISLFYFDADYLPGYGWKISNYGNDKAKRSTHVINLPHFTIKKSAKKSKFRKNK